MLIPIIEGNQGLILAWLGIKKTGGGGEEFAMKVRLGFESSRWAGG